jgi:predicted nucleotidyltransferase
MNISMKNITLYKEINALLLFFTNIVKQILERNLIGVYLTGSLSYGDFNPASSDIDLVSILKKPASKKEIKLLKQIHSAIQKQYPTWAKRLECSYVPVDMLLNILPPKAPRPYFGEGIFYPEAPYGNEWIINNYYLYQSGIPLIGPRFKTLIKPISIKDVQQACIKDLLAEWQPKITDPNYLNNSHYQSYIVLNLCRILYTINRAALTSKKTSANWAKKKYQQWHNLIQEAEKWRYGLEMKRKTETIEFIKFVISQIEGN